jgi:hypothetical protein
MVIIFSLYLPLYYCKKMNALTHETIIIPFIRFLIAYNA